MAWFLFFGVETAENIEYSPEGIMAESGVILQRVVFGGICPGEN